MLMPLNFEWNNPVALCDSHAARACGRSRRRYIGLVQRLGKNIGGYRGETLDIRQIRSAIDSAAAAGGWRRHVGQYDDPALAGQFDFRSYSRGRSDVEKRLYISTGIHGDEPAGPLAVLDLLQENPWPDSVSVWLCPCLNPMGFLRNQRENPGGIDLNRDFRHLRSPEIRAHVAWLEQQPSFTVTLCLHEDWESSGFYLYELNPDGRPTFASGIVDAVASVCPIDLSPMIENWPADGGLIHPPVTPETRPLWPESIYLLSRKTRMSYTMEAPSDFPLSVRRAALAAGVRAVLARL
jgi:hypothetical protein